MLNAYQSDFSLAARPVVSGVVPPSSNAGAPVLPVESSQTGYYLDIPDSAPLKPVLAAESTPVVPGVIVAGTAGTQVTSGASGSHDTVGISGPLLNSLASIGAPSVSSDTVAPMDSPNDFSGTWLIAGIAVVAIWFLLK